MSKKAFPKPPEKGSKTWVPLPEVEEVEVAIKQVGQKQARAWSRRLRVIEREEEARIRKLQRERLDEYKGDRELARLSDPNLFAELVRRELAKSCGSRKDAAAKHPDAFSVPQFATEEANEAYEMLFDDMFSEAIGGVKGVEDLGSTDPQGALEFVEYLEVRQQLMLAVAIINQQSLRPRQLFPASHPGDPGRNESPGEAPERAE